MNLAAFCTVTRFPPETYYGLTELEVEEFMRLARDPEFAPLVKSV